MSIGRLFLSGGGSDTVAALFNEKYFSTLSKNARILYIPAAMEPSRIQSCRKWFEGLLGYNNKEGINFNMLSCESVVPTLEQYDSIYIGGGNTYRLLDYIYKMSLGEKLKNYLARGGIIYGGSAGAIIFGRDIRTAEEEKESYTRDDGLDFLKGISLDCHYSTAADSRLTEVAARIGGSVIALPEPAGLITDAQGTLLELVGEAFIFEKTGKKSKLELPLL